jgi:hypothetical protein|tara:strand:- start:443 stop:634 length:192 start_codon:yes stop_codon:yes gene_type:complete
MKKKLLFVAFILIAIFVIFKYSDHNLNKTVGACMVAQKQTNKSFDVDKARKFCKEEIKKLKNK